MGNSQPRYFSDKESRELLGQASYERLAAQLQGFCEYGHYLDFAAFSGILAAYFEAMVSVTDCVSVCV